MPLEAVEARFDPRTLMEQRGPLVEDVNNFHIQPDHINANQHLFDAFGNNETEISAGYIIRMCQQRGAWDPFTKDEIEEFYKSKGHDEGFSFNHLVDPG